MVHTILWCWQKSCCWCQKMLTQSSTWKLLQLWLVVNTKATFMLQTLNRRDNDLCNCLAVKMFDMLHRWALMDKSKFLLARFKQASNTNIEEVSMQSLRFLYTWKSSHLWHHSKVMCVCVFVCVCEREPLCASMQVYMCLFAWVSVCEGVRASLPTSERNMCAPECLCLRADVWMPVYPNASVSECVCQWLCEWMCVPMPLWVNVCAVFTMTTP